VVDLQARGVLTLQSGGTGIRMLLPYRAGEVELSEVWTTLRACLHARA
jgi:hypothetical protein